MRLGGPVFGDSSTPELWLSELARKRYRAAYCPLPTDSTRTQRAEYADAAREGDIVIAEVGAWCNPLSPDPAEAETSFRRCVAALELADDVGARCCVNIAGNLGPGPWDGASRLNVAPEAFDRVIDSIRRIIDEVSPERTYYSLETMPWMHPYSVSDYREIFEAIDRERFAVHFDPVNLLNSVELHYANREVIESFVDTLGSHIRSVHAKDQTIGTALTVRLDEAPPGEGDLDYDALLQAVSRLEEGTPVLVEHLPDEAAYDRAVSFIRSRAEALEIEL